MAAGQPRTWTAPRAEAGADTTVAQLLHAFLRWADGYYLKAGRRTSEVAVLESAFKVLFEMHASSRIAEFGPVELRAVRDEMVRQGLSRTTVNAYVNRIKRAWRWGASRDMVPGSVLAAITALTGLGKMRSEAREPEPVAAVDEAAVEAVLERVRPSVRVMVRLQLLTGMRPGEVVSMRAADVDRSASPWRYTPRDHKTSHLGHSREVFLGPKAQEVLAPLLEVSPSPESPLFGYTTASYRRAISRACGELADEAKEKGEDPPPAWTPNQLRHTAATAIRRRYGIEAARVLLGHATLSTSEIYAEVDETAAKRIMDEMG
ncbi:MAG: tyrosine-type recombinase/integrase, partial [Planctomycetota bacterium JB042]